MTAVVMNGKGGNEMTYKMLKKYFAFCEGLGIEPTMRGAVKYRDLQKKSDHA